ncbi:MAG: isoprenylcysteine carboxylmethyltransferase family protein [Spirochaetales bacterium]|nr:isoprenylcysteine carboxylmethyltransferase family protein [Spirochaetales bacterium]
MKKRLFAEALAKFLLGAVLVSLFVFLPAGTLDYINGWLFMATMFSPILIIGIILLRKAPKLLEKRLNGNEKERSQQQIVKLSGLVFILSFSLSSLDFRLKLTYLPLTVSISASVVLLLSYALYWEVLRENEFLSRTIEVQENQQVIDSGLYGTVRHPMYSSTTLMFLSIPLVLGSLIGFAIMLIYPFLIAARIKQEESFLSENLSGYKEYLQKVRFRMIPYIW